MSRDILDAFASSPRYGAINTPGGHVGHIVNTPAALGDGVAVVVDGFDPGLKFGPCPWTPKPVAGGLRFPVEGDVCIVVFPPSGAPWVVDWTTQGDAATVSAVVPMGGDLTGTSDNAQIRPGVVGRTELAANVVGSDQIDWSVMPPVILSQATMGDTSVNANYGWLIPTSGTLTPIYGTRTVSRVLPARSGWSRRYRLSVEFAHLAATSGTETAWEGIVSIGGVTVDHYSTNVTTQSLVATSGWSPSAAIDAWGDPSDMTLTARAAYSGTGFGTILMRGYVLEGRYV